MKTCFRCGQTKPLGDYYKHSQMSDGHLNKCKECTKSDSHNRYVKIDSDPAMRSAELARHREKSRRYRDEGRVQRNPIARKEAHRRHTAKFPMKARARDAVARALSKGSIVRQPCEKCGSTNAEAHHEDYAAPLLVVWLCPRHHADRHLEIRNSSSSHAKH